MTSDGDHPDLAACRRALAAAQERLAESEAVLRAIRAGEVDALLVGDSAASQQVYTLSSADRPYRRFVETMRDGVATVSADGIVLYANPRLGELLGTDTSSLVGLPAASLVAPEDRESFAALVGPDGRDGPATTELSVQGAGRVPVPVLVGASRLPADLDEEHVDCLTFTDLTARHAAEAISAELAAIVASTDDGILSAGLDGSVRTWNDAAERLLERDGELLQGRPFATLLATDRAADLPEVLARVAAGSRVEQYETAVRTGTGRRVDVSATFSPVRDPHGRTVGLSAILRDVTERRQLEDERLQATRSLQLARDAALQAVAAKSAFLATMSHEIRTPMNAVIGMTELLLLSELDDQQRQLLEIVRSSGEGLLTIINSVLDFSKIESGELQLEHREFDLWDTVESAIDVLRPTAGAKGLDMVSYVDESPRFAVGDAARLRQVLVNLLGNAVKFTSAGAVLLVVTTEEQTARRVRLHIAVTDSGIGIPAAAMADLFRPFSQVDTSTTRVYGGTGLGLAISRRLVEAMGGDLQVSSTPGEGSTFSFVIEAGTVAGQPGPATPAQAPLTDAGRAVLLVDPVPARRTVLERQLRQRGLRCTGAAGPRDALALVAAGSTFDLAVVDAALSGMTGEELAEALQPAGPGLPLPVIVLTGLGFRPVGGGRNTTFLSKPARAAALSAAVDAALAPVPVPRAPQLPRQPPPPTGDALRVLLAEDNEVNQKVAQLMLRRLGHRVDVVANGREAVEAVRDAAYDVVLMDVQMPVLDGLEATREIRSGLPGDRQPYVVAVTASVLLEDREACSEAGMDAYLPKPVRMQDLREVLATRTRARSSRSSS